MLKGSGNVMIPTRLITATFFMGEAIIEVNRHSLSRPPISHTSPLLVLKGDSEVARKVALEDSYVGVFNESKGVLFTIPHFLVRFIRK